MSYIPELKTPIGDSRKAARTERGRINIINNTRNNIRKPALRSEIRTASPRVRFQSSTSNSKTPISLDQTVRERRKREALDFLRKETRNTDTKLGSSINSASTRPRSGILNSYSTLGSKSFRNPESLKTFELLGETPIEHMPNSSFKSTIYDDETIRNLTKNSFKRTPLSYSNNISDYKSRITKPASLSYLRKNNSLLNSLSNFGSKVFRSILYSEQDTSPNESTNRPHLYDDNGTDGIRNQEYIKSYDIRQKELDLQLSERKKYLDELNKKIAETEKRAISESPTMLLNQSTSIDKQIEKLDERLQNILEEVNSNSSTKLLKELENIKGELTSLRRKQETNNMKFESRFEDIKLENQLNRKKFDNLFSELEQKRRDLDLEKSVLLNILGGVDVQKTSSRSQSKSYNGLSTTAKERFGDRKMHNHSGENIASDSNSDELSDENGYDSEDDQKDILKYIIQNRRKNKINSRKIKTKIKQIKSNLEKIDNASNK